jgi:hypothetical protein
MMVSASPLSLRLIHSAVFRDHEEKGVVSMVELPLLPESSHLRMTQLQQKLLRTLQQYLPAVTVVMVVALVLGKMVE